MRALLLWPAVLLAAMVLWSRPLSAQSPSIDFATYLGGMARDETRYMVLDRAGDIYLVGFTESSNYPMAQSFDNTKDSGPDAFVSIISPHGDSLRFSTYLGGSGGDFAYGVCVGGDGRIFVVGSTSSSNFPLINSIDSSRSGAGDAFVACFGPTYALEWSTLIGGTADEFAVGVGLENESTLVITGATNSTDFPLLHSSQTSLLGPNDAFLVRMNTRGDTVYTSMLIGGSSNDYGISLAIAEDGYVWVGGYTRSSDFPMENAVDSTANGLYDAFLQRYAPWGSIPVYSTFFGGNGDDYLEQVVVDDSGCVYFASNTGSTNYPLFSQFDDTLGGLRDVALTKLSQDGQTVRYSTYLGGAGDELIGGIAVTDAYALFTTGMTASTDFPKQNALDVTLGGTEDIFVVALTPSGDSISFGTYLGGTNFDSGNDIVWNGRSSVIVNATTPSTNYPTVAALDGTANGAEDHVVTRLDFGCCAGSVGNVDCSGDQAPDIGDLSALIDNLFITFTPLCCAAEGNLDGVGGPDISDLSWLIDHLFLSFTPLPRCW